LCASMCLVPGNDARADSLFNQRSAESGTLISSERIRFRPGDLVTVLVRETIDATTESDLEAKKRSTTQSEADPGDNSFLAGRGNSGLGIKKLPNVDVAVNNRVQYDGSTTRTNELVMTISCVVTDVQDNGNVIIAGEKQIQVNRENTLIKFSGLVRARDVAADNTIQSNQIANASIKLSGDGPLWNNQRRGILTKIMDWFSPF
jgi:flagellar L-ring protein FlgH